MNMMEIKDNSSLVNSRIKKKTFKEYMRDIRFKCLQKKKYLNINTSCITKI